MALTDQQVQQFHQEFKNLTPEQQQSVRMSLEKQKEKLILQEHEPKESNLSRFGSAGLAGLQRVFSDAPKIMLEGKAPSLSDAYRKQALKGTDPSFYEKELFKASLKDKEKTSKEKWEEMKYSGLLDSGDDVQGIQDITQPVQTTGIQKESENIGDEEIPMFIKKQTGVNKFGEPVYADVQNPDYIPAKDKNKIKADEQKNYDIYQSDIKRADKLLDTIDRVEAGAENFGMFGEIAVGGTAKADWKNELNYIINNSVVDLMAQMKSQSKTGATGFGQLNKEELNVLKTAATKLRATTTEKRAREILAEMRNDITAIREKKKSLIGGGNNITVMQDADGNEAEVEVDSNGKVIRVIREL